MSRKIAVEGETAHYKASVARRLVRRGWAIWVVTDHVIRRLQERHIPDPEPIPITAKPYIPDDLPRCELPGLKFTLPKGVPSQVIFLARAARVIAENAAR